MSTPAQITICGALDRDTIAALVEVAMNAGAALMVQPRALAAPLTVVEASPKALPPVRSVRAWQVKAGAAEPLVVLDDRVRRALKDGPMPVAEFLRETRLSKYDARKLVASGAIVATGVTHGRRYALPGHPAKGAP